MSALNMFGPAPTAQAQASDNLVEFRAGRMTVTGRQVTADPRKGLVFLKRSAADSLLHFCWSDRTTKQLELDLIVMPGDAEWVPVPQCPTGRVYMLRFKQTAAGSSQPIRHLFWMQEPLSDPDTDRTLADKITKIMSTPTGDSDGGDSDALATREQLMRLLASARGEEGAVTPANVAPATTANNGAQKSLGKLLAVDRMRPVLASDAQRNRLYAHIPAQHDHTAAELESVVGSAQFRQAVAELDAALQSGALAALFQELGLDVVKILSAPPHQRTAAFLRELQRQYWSGAAPSNN